jgi:hypothetical protein
MDGPYGMAEPVDLLETPHSGCAKPAVPVAGACLRLGLQVRVFRVARGMPWGCLDMPQAYPFRMAYVAAGITIDNGTVLMLITVLALPIAAIAFASAGGAWKQIGKGRFAIEQEPPPSSRPAPPNPSVERAVQAAEARQMLEAKSYRRVRQGQPALDVEAELREVLADGEGLRAGGGPAADGRSAATGADEQTASGVGPASSGVGPASSRADAASTGVGAALSEVDPELRAEVRRLVMIRNERRVREGKAPLDVEAETERQLADFIGSPY